MIRICNCRPATVLFSQATRNRKRLQSPKQLLTRNYSACREQVYCVAKFGLLCSLARYKTRRQGTQLNRSQAAEQQHVSEHISCLPIVVKQVTGSPFNQPLRFHYGCFLQIFNHLVSQLKGSLRSSQYDIVGVLLNGSPHRWTLLQSQWMFLN